MKTLTTTWTGIRPLIMHNGRLVDPEDPIAQQISEINKSKLKTDAMVAKRSRLEYEGSLYWDRKLGPYIPADNVERCIQLGAAKSRVGKDVQAAVFCTEDSVLIPLEYEGPRDIEKLYADKRYQLRKGVVVQRNRIIRVRPMFPTGWKITFTLEFDETVIDAKRVVQAMVDAGARIGLGDWRPKFGRFLVEVA